MKLDFVFIYYKVNAQYFKILFNGFVLAHAGERLRRSIEAVQFATSQIGLPAAYMALYPYKPQKADELELRKGAVYTVTERCQDGWFKGTNNRTQKTGVFPGNYVALCRTVSRTPHNHGQNDSKLTTVSMIYSY